MGSSTRRKSFGRGGAGNIRTVSEAIIEEDHVKNYAQKKAETKVGSSGGGGSNEDVPESPDSSNSERRRSSKVTDTLKTFLSHSGNKDGGGNENS